MIYANDKIPYRAPRTLCQGSEKTMTESRMSSYIKRIATGPKMSKDLSREEARDGMELILAGEADPVQAAIFLIALRMKRESEDENLGILEALRAHTHFSCADVDDLIDIADPYDGFLRHLPAGPFLPALLAACWLPAVSHGCEQLGPKFGLTHHQILAAAGINVNLNPEDAAACVSNPEIGWAYVDQRFSNPDLYGLAELRRLIVKRPCLATLEKFCGPIRARGKNHLMVGYVHTAYEQLLPQLARHAGYASALVVRGIEGGVVPPLNALSKLAGFNADGVDISDRLAPREAGIESIVRNTALPDGADSMQVFHHQAMAVAAAQEGLNALNGVSGPMRDSLVLAAAAVLQRTGRANSIDAGAMIARTNLDSGAACARFQALMLVN
ncbi:MAG: anthranilate phosphoribosyltransferase [Gammaproteobacteria bacterium]